MYTQKSTAHIIACIQNIDTPPSLTQLPRFKTSRIYAVTPVLLQNDSEKAKKS